MHMWQLKTFWHEAKISLDDIECLGCEDMETLPAVPLQHTSDHVQRVAQRLKEVKQRFDEIVSGSMCKDDIAGEKGKSQHLGDLLRSLNGGISTSELHSEILLGGSGTHDMKSFWHRKTGTVVCLSV